MHVTIAAQHSPHAPFLQSLLGPAHTVGTLAQLPATGPIVTDVLITTRLSADEASRLQARLLHAPSAGLDAIARDALPADCLVCNVYEHETAIAEYVTHAILQHQIFGFSGPAPMDAAHWPRAYRERPLHNEAAGTHVAIVGFGRIGRTTARRLRALDMKVTAVTRHRRREAGADATHAVSALHELLPDVDFLLLCCPLTPGTRGMIGERELAAMKPGAVLINVGRAHVVDEAALYQALRDGRLGGAVLDVWYHYPGAEAQLAPSAFPFHTLPNVRCTPHIAAWTHGLIARRYRFIARNIQRLAAGEALENRC
ncbi:MAG: 2-hydroxyacid dehydrogenase [Castellaniella sp.]